MKSVALFSFFAGAGFLDLGFEDEGFHVSYVNEYHPPFLEAYKHARAVLSYPEPAFGYAQCSIEHLCAHELRAHIKSSAADAKIVGFIGGPPCPDFSVGGKNRGKDGENGKLSRIYVDLICQERPDFFLFENVKGLYKTKKHREFFEGLKTKLRQTGYHLHERLINSIEYGAPQDRERIILLGFRDPSLPQAFSWEGRSYPDDAAFKYAWPIIDVFEEEEIKPPKSKIPLDITVQHWFDKNRVHDHPNAEHCFKPRAGLERFKEIAEGDDSRKSYKRLHRWRYSPTAAYGNNEVHLHPYKARRITVAEALAVQSLPASFELPASMTLSNMFKTVGNGVPYLAARGLAKSIAKHLGVFHAGNSAESCPRNQPTAA